MKESLTRDASHAGLFQQDHCSFLAILSGQRRNIRKDVIRPLRDVSPESNLLKNLTYSIALSSIFAREFLIKRIIELGKSNGNAVLQRGRSADVDQIIHVADPFSPL